MLSLIAMDYFRQSPVLAMPIIALALFMLVFLAVTLRAMLTKKTSFEQIARLPLEDASHEESHHE